MLWAAVERAAGGSSAAVLIGGEAGVGKSRLLLEFAEAARAEELLVLLGRCVDVGDGELPYAPVAGALRSLAAQLAPAELQAALGPARAELARLVPGLGGDEADPAAPASAGPLGQARLFELLLGTLGRLAARRPVLLLIEDLHWADGSTRDLVRFLVRSGASERFVLVATYRTDDLHQAHPLRPYLVELRRDPQVSGVDLRPFTRAEFADQVAAIAGSLPEAAALDRLYARSEGNAFFTEELLAARPGRAGIRAAARVAARGHAGPPGAPVRAGPARRARGRHRGAARRSPPGRQDRRPARARAARRRCARR